MARKPFYEMSAESICDMIVKKAERKGHTRSEVTEIYCWLLGYTPETFSAVLASGMNYAELFRQAPAVNPRYTAVTGVICGVRVEEIEDEMIRLMRCIDKMVDELCKGKAMEKILRSDAIPSTVDEYIAAQGEMQQKCLNAVRQTIRDAIPDAKEILSYGMPTFWKDHNLIHYAAQKKHIGIYPGGEATEVFAEKLKNFDVSKGTIRIPYSDDLPLELIAEIARWCREHNA